MKIVRFTVSGSEKYGILTGKKVQQLSDDPFSGINPLDNFYNLDEIKLLAPCRPSKIVAIGINYHSHATEFKHDLPDSPLMFLKPSTAVYRAGRVHRISGSVEAGGLRGRTRHRHKPKSPFDRCRGRAELRAGLCLFQRCHRARPSEKRTGSGRAPKGFRHLRCYRAVD